MYSLVRSLVVILLSVVILTAVRAQGPTEGMVLRLQVGVFDPLTHQPATAASDPAFETPYYIVQFVGPIEEGWTEQVEAVGATLLGYLPDNAYVIRIAADDLPKLRALPSVRWVGPYLPDYKLSPALTSGAMLASADPVAVRLIAFPGETVETITALLNSLGATIEEASETPIGAVARARVPIEAVAALSRAPAVSWIEPDLPFQVANAQGRKILNAERIWTRNNLFGDSQIVAVSDSGLDVQQGNTVANADFAGRLVRAYAPSEMNPNIPACAAKTNWTDLNGHGTHVAGSVLGSGVNSGSNPEARQYANSEAGVAPRARLVFMAMNHDGSSAIQCVPSNGNYIAFGYQNGARISSNSWGANTRGAYTANDSVVDDYIWRNRDYLVLFSAGNAGPAQGTIGSPGSAKNVLTIGASENNRPDLGEESDNPNAMANFSSRGPTADGRVKPEVVAPGTNVVSVRGGAVQRGYEPIAPGRPYARASGTSMATPLAAGAATLLREWLVTQRGVNNPSAALLKALLIHGAFQLPGAATPNMNSGWGRVDLSNTIEANYVLFEDDQTGLRTGDSRTFTVQVAGSTSAGTLFVMPDSPVGATDIGLLDLPLPQAAAQTAEADPGALSVSALPGYETPPPARPIHELAGQSRGDLPVLTGLQRPTINLAEARPLTPLAPDARVQDFRQGMVGGGDFEDPGWTEIWSRVWLGAGLPVRTDRSDQVINGNYSIWLGGSPSDDLIAYPLSFPETIDSVHPSTLSFLVRQTNWDRGYDYFCVALVDASGYPFRTSAGLMLSCSDSLPEGVRSIQITFSPAERAALAGQTGYLYLFTSGDGLVPHMSAFVDDVSLIIDFPPVSLRAVPASGPPGMSFLLTGANNVPYGAVQICRNNCGSNENVLATVYADARGDVQVMVRTSTSIAPGTYTLETKNVAGRTARTTFTILGAQPPTLEVTPASGPPGTSFGFEGRNFLPNDATIRVQINGEVLGTIGSDAGGAVRFRVTTQSNTAPGTYTIRVTDSAGRSAERDFQVTAPRTEEPQMSVTPTEGAAGATFTFTGRGFAPDQTVNFTLEGSPVGQASTNAAGEFRLTLQTSPALTPGSYTLTATQGERRATATFRIRASEGGTPSAGGLAVTLVWTDPPAQTGAGRALVNNLNLRVEGPNNQVWYGNGGNSPDEVNNVETVRIPRPAAGTYRIIVQAASTSPAHGAQPFAIVATAGQGQSNSALATDNLRSNVHRVFLPLALR